MSRVRKGTLSARIEAFYLANPDEELTYQQIADKFSCDVHTARNAVHWLVDRGVVESVHIVRPTAKGRGRAPIVEQTA